jgi:regulatory protein
LSVRPHSVSEITAFLKRKTSAADLINQTIKKLQDLNYLDDQKFAQWLIASRSRSRPRGHRLLIQELKLKGIDPEIITAGLNSAGDELMLARQALSKKASLWKKLSYHDFRIKAGRFLSARGFSWEIVNRVIKDTYYEDKL